MQSPMPYEWLTLDIETIAGSPEDADQYIINCYRPDSFGSWSDLTIGKKIREAHRSKLLKLSLLNAAPIICVSLKSNIDLSCFHCMPKGTITEAHGARVFPYPDQAAMMVALRDWLDYYVSPDTVTVGHNILGFDLPKLRWAFLRYGVRLPNVLATKHPAVFDIMKIYTSQFAVGSGMMIGLRPLLEEFGVESHKSLVDGSDVQELYEAGEHDTIIRYALLDVIAESELFLRMTGRLEALK